MHVALYPLISVALFAANAVLPQIGIITGVFSPLVLMLYLAHEKRDKQYDIFLIVLIVSLAVVNHTLAAFYVISPLFTAVFIRYANRNKLQTSWLPVAGAAALSFAVTFIIIYTLTSYREGLIEFTANAMQTFINAAKETNAPMAQSPYFAQVENNLNETALALVLIFPAFNYMYTVFSAFVSQRIFAKMKNVPVETFRMPDFIVWILIGSLFLIFAPIMYGRFIGINISMAFLALYAFQGFEILLYWMNRFNVMPILKALIFIFIFSEPPIILIISLIGLFSVWFNFYGRKPDEEQESSE